MPNPWLYALHATQLRYLSSLNLLDGHQTATVSVIRRARRERKKEKARDFHEQNRAAACFWVESRGETNGKSKTSNFKQPAALSGLWVWSNFHRTGKGNARDPSAACVLSPAIHTGSRFFFREASTVHLPLPARTRAPRDQDRWTGNALFDMSNESEGGVPLMGACDECRDDVETRRAPAVVFDRSAQESRDAVASHGGIDEDEEGDMNMTRLDEEESNLDINSVISGMEEDEEGNVIGDDQFEGVFGKNLSSCFDSVGRMASSSSSSHRPPLPPTRDVAIPTDKPSVLPQVVPGAGDKRLSVFLRVRPPVCSNGKKGNEGAANTIEIIEAKSAATQRGYAPTLPTTVRTYPPLNSNAAKVVRCGGKVPTEASSGNSKKAPSSKSLIDDGSADSDKSEVRGVKEYSYSGVFGPKSTQSEVYNNIAAPLVDGLFPRDKESESLGESALLFTLGVTNAGKTHTVMGTGFGSKGGRKPTDCPGENWGIIPRALHHILTRIDGSNSAAATNAGGPKLQMYMSYLEIYNESIYVRRKLLGISHVSTACAHVIFFSPPRAGLAASKNTERSLATAMRRASYPQTSREPSWTHLCSRFGQTCCVDCRAGLAACSDGQDESPHRFKQHQCSIESIAFNLSARNLSSANCQKVI